MKPNDSAPVMASLRRIWVERLHHSTNKTSPTVTCACNDPEQTLDMIQGIIQSWLHLLPLIDVYLYCSLRREYLTNHNSTTAIDQYLHHLRSTLLHASRYQLSGHRDLCRLILNLSLTNNTINLSIRYQWTVCNSVVWRQARHGRTNRQRWVFQKSREFVSYSQLIQCSFCWNL